MDEYERLNIARSIILDIIKNKGRDYLYDLTGLSGGFIISKEEIGLIETYIGSAIFSEKLNKYGLEHLDGNLNIHKSVGFNRTSSGIFSTIAYLSKEIDEVIHYLPKKPSHPSIPRSCKVFNIPYFESDNFEEIISKIKDNNRKKLVVITGATMDHKIIDFDNLKKIINICNDLNHITFVDDASGARLRTLLGQKSALSIGSDLVITSTDKLMDGPRAGLMAGKKDLVDKIYEEGLKYGLEAQPPIMCGMINAIKNYNISKLKKAFDRAKNIDLSKLEEYGLKYEKTPTGFIVKNLSENDSVNVALIMLKDYGIITIACAGMPGASKTLRIDLCSKDADRITDNYIIDAIVSSYEKYKKEKNN